MCVFEAGSTFVKAVFLEGKFSQQYAEMNQRRARHIEEA